jgi:NADPH:quinone reductase-like Zn-dependent oxidoreductase
MSDNGRRRSSVTQAISTAAMRFKATYDAHKSRKADFAQPASGASICSVSRRRPLLTLERYCLSVQSGAIKPIVAKTFPLAEAAAALRYLVEGRPFGRVVLTI